MSYREYPVGSWNFKTGVLGGDMGLRWGLASPEERRWLNPGSRRRHPTRE